MVALLAARANQLLFTLHCLCPADRLYAETQAELAQVRRELHAALCAAC